MTYELFPALDIECLGQPPAQGSSCFLFFFFHHAEFGLGLLAQRDPANCTRRGLQPVLGLQLNFVRLQQAAAVTAALTTAAPAATTPL